MDLVLHDTIALDPTYVEFGYNEHPATTSRFLCIKIIDYNVKKFGYNEHPLITSSFFCIFLLVVSGTQCSYNGTCFVRLLSHWSEMTGEREMK